MRATRAKELRRMAAREYPKGSKMVRKNGGLFWTGARRAYRDSKKVVAK